MIWIGFADHFDDLRFAGPVYFSDEVIDAFFLHTDDGYVFSRTAENVACLTGSTLGNVDLGSQHGEQSCKRAGGRARIVAEQPAVRQCL